MKKGDILQIDGWFGFTKDPEMIVLDFKGEGEGELVLLAQYPQKKDALLYNESWHQKSLLKIKSL